MVFSGAAASSLRQFRAGDADGCEGPTSPGPTSPLSAERPLPAPRAKVAARVSRPQPSQEVSYSVAGDRDEFTLAVADLKSWRMARAKSGWSPAKGTGEGGRDGGRDEGETVLRVRSEEEEEGEEADKGGRAVRQGAPRPGTAPAETSEASERRRPSEPTNFSPWEPAGPRDRTPRDRTDVGTPVTDGATDGEACGTFSELPTRRPKEGEGMCMSDLSLISLLRKKPKLVTFLRTRSGFREFFLGVPQDRMRRLLTEAYSGLEEGERERKVGRRMRVVEGGGEGGGGGEGNR